MPKNNQPAGGRPAKNFDPRYGGGSSYQDRKRRDDAGPAKAGSKSPKHRGYRAEGEGSATPEKRRWTSQERAGRDAAQGVRSNAQGGARRRDDEAPGRDRPRYDGGARRDDRPARDGDRPRFERSDRPRFERSDRPRYESGARRDDRPAREGDRPRYQGNSDRPRYDGGARRDDRPARDGDRPRFERSDRPRFERSDRPRYEGGARRDDRPVRDGRPARDGDRPRYQGNSDRPRYEGGARRDDRPVRDGRPARDGDRPRYQGNSDRPRRDDGFRAAPARSAEHENRIDVVHERLQAQAVDTTSAVTTSFGDLGLGENIVKVLADMGAASPFPIQAATVAPILEGRDVLARGRTGSGKTIAFGAPLVESVLRSQAGGRREFGRKPKAIILAPTRELALQIDGVIQPIARSVGLFTTQIYGGVPQARQVGALKKGVDIIIGTPGRIEDLIEQRKLDLSEVTIAVLDEADHMCELGFLEPVQRILRRTSEGSQKLLFSATLDREVAALVDEFLVEPAVYEVAGEDQDSSTIEHRVIVIDQRDKAEILTSLVDREGKTLVFARTRAFAEMLSDQFEDAGIRSVALHGDLNQARRTRNLEQLTKGRVSVLVATDVAARGIHVDDIDLVIQADPPDEYKTYMHRSGRTGRAGRSGRVVTLITRQRRRRMTELLNRAEIDAPFEEARAGDELIDALAGRPTVAELTD